MQVWGLRKRIVSPLYVSLFTMYVPLPFMTFSYTCCLSVYLLCFFFVFTFLFFLLHIYLNICPFFVKVFTIYYFFPVTYIILLYTFLHRVSPALRKSFFFYVNPLFVFILSSYKSPFRVLSYISPPHICLS